MRTGRQRRAISTVSAGRPHSTTLDVNMSGADSTKAYGWTLIFIASVILVAGIFGASENDLVPLIGVAIVCAVAGYGVLRVWAWAKWLALVWGPLVVVVGAVVLWIANRPVSVLEYAAGIAFAVAWVWDAHRRLTLGRTDGP